MECALLGHISWMRQMMERGIVHSIEWCDTRDMTADGHTKGGIDREMLLHTFQHDFNRHTAHRAGQTRSSEAA
eukprot:1470216-Pyramimonas_sp.AAC.1